MEIELLTKADLKNFEAKLDRILEDLKLIRAQSGLEPKSKWLDNEDLLKLLDVSSRTLQKWRDTGVLPFTRIARKVYYRADDVDKLLNSNLTGGWQLGQLR
jgi:hypothetical protein